MRQIATALCLLIGLAAGCGEPEGPPLSEPRRRIEPEPTQAPAPYFAASVEGDGLAERRGYRSPPAAPGGGSAAVAASSAPRVHHIIIRISPVARELLGDGFEPAFEVAHPGIQLELHRSSDRGAIAEVLEDRAEVALVATTPSPNELAQGAGGVALGYHIPALALHRDNPVRSLAADRIHELLTGKVLAWERIAYQKGEIQLAVGPKGAVGERTATLLIPGDRYAGEAVRLGTDREVLARVAGQPAAVGVVGLVPPDRAAGVRWLAVNGVGPDVRSYLAGRYPYGCPLQLVYQGHPTSATRTLLAFARSSAGRELLKGRLMLQ